ncbi:hypothetical protein [Gracilimonas mengyeensis]|nr:hypothetical protein [Gracilimonas mengyeensis]
MKSPLLFTGMHPDEFEVQIKKIEQVVEKVQELKQDELLAQKIDYLRQGLHYLNEWLGVERFTDDNALVLKEKSGRQTQSEEGKVFIPVVRGGGAKNTRGRLRKLEVQLVGEARRSKYEIKPLFGVIGADAGKIGQRAAKAAGKLFQENGVRTKYWSSTASFELNHAWHAGHSANLALSGLFYCEMLQGENSREYFKLNPSMAVTGDIDEDGKVLPVEEKGLREKVHAAFFSWVQVMVVPMDQLEQVTEYVQLLNKRFPNRHLILKGVGHLRELFYDRRISLHVQRSLISLTAKQVWKKKVNAVFGLIIAILIGIIAWLQFGPVDQNPVSIEYSGEYLVLKNQYDITVDRIELGEVAVEKMVEKHGENPRGLLYDMNGDGVNELIWSKSMENYNRENTFIQAWSVSGDSIIWQQPVKMEYGFPRQYLANEGSLNITEMAVVEVDGISKLIVTANVGNFFPASVRRLNLITGAKEQEYMHAGQISDMAVLDLDKDGQEDLVFTGVNNAFWLATVFVLDPADLQGHSPLQGDYVVEGMGRANEDKYLFIPKTIVGKYYSFVEKFNFGWQVYIDKSRELFWVKVREVSREIENYGKQEASVYIYFNYNLEPVSFITSNHYDIIARELYQKGDVPFIPDYEYWEAFKDSVIYWDGSMIVQEEISK